MTVIFFFFFFFFFFTKQTNILDYLEGWKVHILKGEKSKQKKGEKSTINQIIRNNYIEQTQTSKIWKNLFLLQPPFFIIRSRKLIYQLRSIDKQTLEDIMSIKLQVSSMTYMQCQWIFNA